MPRSGVVNLPNAVTDHPDQARAWIGTHFGSAGLVPSYRALFDRECARGPADVVVAGDEHEVEQQLHSYADAGATEFIAVPFGSREQIDRTLTFLAHLNREAPV
jgi:hypothetical protein